MRVRCGRRGQQQRPLHPQPLASLPLPVESPLAFALVRRSSGRRRHLFLLPTSGPALLLLQAANENVGLIRAHDLIRLALRCVSSLHMPAGRLSRNVVLRACSAHMRASAPLKDTQSYTHADHRQTQTHSQTHTCNTHSRPRRAQRHKGSRRREKQRALGHAGADAQAGGWGCGRGANAGSTPLATRCAPTCD